MADQDVKKRVYSIIAEHTGKNINDADHGITDDSKFIDDLGLDSLDLVELVMAFEEEFGQEIPDKDAEELTTVGKTIEYIQSKQNGSASAA
jgi:acyl carrier protein